jgi:hypothetical protein
MTKSPIGYHRQLRNKEYGEYEEFEFNPNAIEELGFQTVHKFADDLMLQGIEKGYNVINKPNKIIFTEKGVL